MHTVNKIKKTCYFVLSKIHVLANYFSDLLSTNHTSKNISGLSKPLLVSNLSVTTRGMLPDLVNGTATRKLIPLSG